MKIGYCRVSTEDQNLDGQEDMLTKHGCERIFSEKISSMKFRPELDKAIGFLREGDSLVIVKLDRLGRSLSDLKSLVSKIQERKAEIVSLTENIDTSTSNGRLFFHIFAAIAEFERDMISERTKFGIAARKRKGVKVGRKPGISEAMKQKAIVAEDYHKSNTRTVKEICELLAISRATLYKLLRLRGWTPNDGWKENDNN